MLIFKQIGIIGKIFCSYLLFQQVQVLLNIESAVLGKPFFQQ